jgi:hypothetical protein
MDHTIVNRVRAKAKDEFATIKSLDKRVLLVKDVSNKL